MEEGTTPPIYRADKASDGTYTIFDVPVFAAHSEVIIPVMRKLDAMGCIVVMDGSPLEQECLDILRGVPVSISKICFAALDEKVNEAGVGAASSLIRGWHRMDVKVVVVGVENDDHAELVRQTGCSLSQGHRFKSPLSADHVLQLLAVIKKTKDAFKIL